MTARSLRPVGADYGAPFFLIPLFALYGNLMPLGAWGYLLGAVLGAIWSLVLILAVRALRSDPARASIAADATLLLSTVGLGAVAASGLLYMLVFGAVLHEPTATYAVLSAMMGPTVGFFIVLNGLLEMLLVPLALALNLGKRRRQGLLIGAAALTYWLMRAWTYATFAEPRAAMSTRTLSDADVAWFRETIATDQRVYLVALACLLLVLAALWRTPRHPPRV